MYVCIYIYIYIYTYSFYPPKGPDGNSEPTEIVKLIPSQQVVGPKCHLYETLFKVSIRNPLQRAWVQRSGLVDPNPLFLFVNPCFWDSERSVLAFRTAPWTM